MELAEIHPIIGDLGKEKQILSCEDNTLIYQEGTQIQTWELDSLQELKVHHLVGSIMLLAKTENDEIVLLRGSLGQAREYQIFAQAVNSKITGRSGESRWDHIDDRCPKCNRLYPDPARPVCPRCLDKRSLFKRVLSLTPPYGKEIALMVFLMISSSLVGLIPPYLGGRIFYDEVLRTGCKYSDRLGLVVFSMFLAELFILLLNIGHGRVNAKVAAQIVCDLKTQVFTAMQRLSLKFYNHQQTGSLMTRVNGDANHL